MEQIMIKKISFLLWATCGLQSIQSTEVNASAYTNSKLFDAESADFSKISTIKTWVADKHHGKKNFMEKLQSDIAMTVPQNPFAIHFVSAVRNNEGDQRYFGKSFHTLEAAELPFLQFVKKQSALGPINTLEIAASIGLVSWKVPYAFANNGHHYANDLSTVMLDQEFQMVMNKRLQDKALKESISKLPGDCFNLLTQRPDLKGKFNAIYVQNLEHFFNPIQHQQFISLINELLAENGQAFLTAHSVPLKDKNDSITRYYFERIVARDPYPGFMEYTVEFTKLKGKELITEHKLSNPSRPADDTTVKAEDMGAPANVTLIDPTTGDCMLAEEGRQRVVSNAYSPVIYKTAVAHFPLLEVIDSFYMDKSGKKKEKLDPTVSHAVAIIRKKPAVTIPEATIEQQMDTLSGSSNH
jgi:hypothetical protein